ncbi:glycoside hydrolase family 55 protein [Reichenbachiella ulvae]|uniref:Glycoside hydrolase family 55 protein n=1 Tax=Reichenbachiella ulvae TaxID=2980104 RepID=A0ABT3CUK3_9BACT|nr:glycoside hydrolase family 55 protein [Reichenbachiella ulvae]MCV9387299.1 glycoside hydrolase family 55 protein [Reichenbachiella ulvae]
MKRHLFCAIFLFASASLQAQLPQILTQSSVQKEHYLPDFSYAGYHFSEEEIPFQTEAEVINVSDFGAIPDDGLDDSRALRQAMETAHQTEGKVRVVFPAGRFILSEVLYIRRSDLVLSGAGSGSGGTTLYYPRPMRYFEDPEALAELREYLVELDKRQREPENNLDLPFSQYAWSGGMIWVQVEGARVKSYLDKYDEAPHVLAELSAGQRGQHWIKASSTQGLKVGDVALIEWYNPEGKEGSLIEELYDGAKLKVGSHHWNYPDHALVIQQVQIEEVKKGSFRIKDPLLHDIRVGWNPKLVEWKHLEEVGIEHFNIEFPMAPNIAHHVEDGYNAIYLTNLFNGWVTDVKIKNADSGILTEQISNVTIDNIETTGEKMAHYSVSMGSVHNVFVSNLHVRNRVKHPLSFNTHATKSVYSNCFVYQEPVLDQHSGANHQNLFDNITVYVDLNGQQSYPLFAGGGAGYWKPSHGAFTTFWNVKVNFLNGFDQEEEVTLDGMKDGPSARLVGVHANRPIKIQYGPQPYIAATNQELRKVPSLFTYQLLQRKK